VNKSGLPLIFRQDHCQTIAAGQFEEHEIARCVAPLLFCFADKEKYELYVYICKCMCMLVFAIMSHHDAHVMSNCVSIITQLCIILFFSVSWHIASPNLCIFVQSRFLLHNLLVEHDIVTFVHTFTCYVGVQ